MRDPAQGSTPSEAYYLQMDISGSLKFKALGLSMGAWAFLWY